MLEVKNLTKIYKPKNGVEVKALDNVSLSFPEKGMVFLLGKSGSGKSTLLNVSGGLDAPTSGEIIVKGRSSKNFSQSDFDSYRNTFIGFVFQEYNILNEFSVEDNIALALELQNKPKDKAAVEQLLKEVDLSGYAKRKPNTLSGGQKQRIAIARALIKKPEIIMADEPSGALDSATGKQVFETLKKLSQDKLVIVVSHDRDSAELYGDRIIELMDGKVISDVSKSTEKQSSVTENVDNMGDVLRIKKGAALSEKDFAEIKKFLAESDGDVIIASGKKEVQEFKKVTRITDNGREVFRQTKETPQKTYTPAESKFIRSRLPLRHATKIGLSGMKSKPVRLFFTILLCVVAFAMFGLLSTMMVYDSEPTFKETLINSGKETVRLNKQYKVTTSWYNMGELQHSYEGRMETKFSEKEVTSLKNEFGSNTFGATRTYLSYNVVSLVAPYWNNQISAVGYLGEDNALRARINGQYPEKDDEICISSYIADVLINCQTYDATGNAVEYKSHDELIGKPLRINEKEYKISGILDCGSLPAKFDSMKDSSNNAGSQMKYNLEIELNDGLYCVAFTNESALKQISKNYSSVDMHKYDYRRAAITVDINGDYYLPEYGNTNYAAFSEIVDTTYFIDASNTTVEEGEVMLSEYAFYEYLARVYENRANDLDYEKDEEKYSANQKTLELCYNMMSEGKWMWDEENGTDSFVNFTEEEMATYRDTLLKAMRDDKIEMNTVMRLYDERAGMATGDILNLKVIGFVEAKRENMQYAYLTADLAASMMETQKNNLEYYEEYKTKYVQDATAVYSDIYLPFDGSAEKADAIWDMYANTEFNEDDSIFVPTGVFIETLRSVDSMVQSMSKVFLYAGLVLAVFAALLFSNFISVSISQKKKEIGILRAIGAKSSDVFKIFFSESTFIALVCIVLSSIGCYFFCGYLNVEMAESLGASLLVFGIPSFAMLLGIAAVTAVLATFFPVRSAARKKPIESIRAI